VIAGRGVFAEFAAVPALAKKFPVREKSSPPVELSI
jgi:hypothetical protein